MCSLSTTTCCICCLPEWCYSADGPVWLPSFLLVAYILKVIFPVTQVSTAGGNAPPWSSDNSISDYHSRHTVWLQHCLCINLGPVWFLLFKVLHQVRQMYTYKYKGKSFMSHPFGVLDHFCAFLISIITSFSSQISSSS